MDPWWWKARRRLSAAVISSLVLTDEIGKLLPLQGEGWERDGLSGVGMTHGRRPVDSLGLLHPHLSPPLEEEEI